MDVYLGFGLLSAAIVVLVFILFDNWFKSRNTRMAEMMGTDDNSIDDREFVLGADSNELANLELHDNAFEHFTPTHDYQMKSETILEVEQEDDFAAEYDAPAEISQPIEKPQEAQRATASQDKFLILSVMAHPSNRFASYDLLQAISTAGLQFGEMNIFHYYQQTMSGKVTLFSLASANKPGDFDLSMIGDFSCSGLVLFMDIARVPDPQNAFRLMLDIAERLAEDLDGELRADPRTPWNEKLVWQYQQKIMQYKSTARYDRTAN